MLICVLYAHKEPTMEIINYSNLFYYKITRVFSAHREQYPNSFKCISIFYLFLCLQKDIQQTVLTS